ncbi:TFIIA-alpha and beta-like factor [Phyllopteryx taeniolatus]|uniref:TFIIA-alpha and beta-like factor n=1 Tax=Phyllopteryx taeniolatus TaxID=161469 RepID=UPI002AD3646F|nr:TFIIA-alpha and beta-like factor [Phyllopteryx taeniolatus]
MLINMGPMVAKLYLSIIDDVIESMRELFLDEGLEDCILDNLRHLWETKTMESKTMDDFRKNNSDSPDFVLQLPANYRRNDAELTASVVIPASQNIHSFPVKNNSETLATFSLPAGLSYPVQIPAGVTLQTASGQLYKVNVPVVVTQAPAGQQTVSQPPPASFQPGETLPQEAPPVPTLMVNSSQLPDATLPPSQESSVPQQDPYPAVSQLVGSEEALTKTTQFKSSDIDDILKEFIKEEREKAARARNLAHTKCCDQPEAILGLDLDFNYSELSDIVQLDGTADNSDMEEEEVVPLEENDFLGMINAEAIKALQEGVGSSDGNTGSSSSDSEGPDELEHVEDEDPLNSGDDVFEQDIPDLFDSENVIVCQYDKIHRSKNRWKFHLKDGVMCYGGRDYVFSKAVGEAEW